MNTRRINTDMLNDPFFIGFDSIFNKLNTQTNQAGNYPPYNIIKTDEDTYVIEVAVAGFDEEDLDITVHNGTLTIKGDVTTKEGHGGQYLHRGIAARNFTRTFTIADTIEVLGAQIYNGMLQVRLQNIIPESKKPKKIAIGSEKPKELLTE
jgi:molecular chaperone IbpA